jgi:thiol-disulfide isomerase/thioredoxin
MTKKKRRKTSSLPKILVIVGVALLAMVVLLIKDRPQAATIATNTNELPEVQLNRSLEAKQPTLAFYHSTNCKQCIVMMDIVGEVYPDYIDSIILVDIDVYDERNVPLLTKVGLQYIPTLMFYDQSGERQVHVGVMEAEQLHQTLTDLAGD